MVSDESCHFIMKFYVFDLNHVENRFLLSLIVSCMNNYDIMHQNGYNKIKSKTRDLLLAPLPISWNDASRAGVDGGCGEEEEKEEDHTKKKKNSTACGTLYA